MLLLDDMREAFATFLTTNSRARWRMDAALAHVVTLAYQQGIKDGKKDSVEISNRKPASFDSDSENSTAI